MQNGKKTTPPKKNIKRKSITYAATSQNTTQLDPVMPQPIAQRTVQPAEPPKKRDVKIIPMDMGKFVVRVMVAILLLGFMVLVWRSATMLLLLFAAIIVALVLRTIANQLKRITRLGDTLNVLLATVLVFSAVASIFTIFGSLISQQFELIIDKLPHAYTKLGSIVGQQRLDNFTHSLTPSGANLMSNITAQTQNITAVFSDLLLAVLGGIYLALDPTSYAQGFTKLIPHKARESVSQTFKSIAIALRHWLSGQFLVMIVVGLCIGLGLSLVGVPAAITLGLIAFMLEFIPVLGPFLSAIPGLLIALTIDEKTFFLTLLVYVVVQQVEGNILSPIVMKRTVSVPAVVSLFALYFLSELFGILGIILGGPLTVALYVAIRQFWMKRVLNEPLAEEQTKPIAHKNQP